MAIKDIVPKNQSTSVVPDELAADNESLGESAGRGLYGV
jgi:hypothetical protein